MSNTKCPIWGTCAFFDIKGSEVTIDSPRAAGGFRLDTMLFDKLKDNGFTDQQRAMLTTRIIDLRFDGSYTTVKIPAPLVTEEDVDPSTARPLRVTQRSDRLLRCLAQEPPHIGKLILFRADSDLPDDLRNRVLAYSESTVMEEVLFLRDDLLAKDLIRKVPGGVVVTVDGYAHLYEPEDRASEAMAARIDELRYR